MQQYQGALQANEAQVNNARLQLTYTKVVAPIDGRLGLRQVDPGNLIRAGDANGLVVITQMRPISVLFTVPEAELPAVLEALRRGERLACAGVGPRRRKCCWPKARSRRWTTRSTPPTGTIKLRAQFANEQEQLFPNQFVNIRLRVSTFESATVIPAAAVQRASFGTFVYAVKPDSTVTIKRIALGPCRRRPGGRDVRTGGIGARGARRSRRPDGRREGRGRHGRPGSPAGPRAAAAGRAAPPAAVHPRRRCP